MSPHLFTPSLSSPSTSSVTCVFSQSLQDLLVPSFGGTPVTRPLGETGEGARGARPCAFSSATSPVNLYNYFKTKHEKRIPKMELRNGPLRSPPSPLPATAPVASTGPPTRPPQDTWAALLHTAGGRLGVATSRHRLGLLGLPGGPKPGAAKLQAAPS